MEHWNDELGMEHWNDEQFYQNMFLSLKSCLDLVSAVEKFGSFEEKIGNQNQNEVDGVQNYFDFKA